jgi:hypothetical protein
MARSDEEVAADRARTHPDGMKRCRHGEWRPFADFHVARNTLDGLQTVCRNHYCNRLRKYGMRWWRFAGIDPGTCFYCRAPSTEVDHIVPVSRGGTNMPVNLVPACSSCNGSKQAQDPLSWIAGRMLPDHPGWDEWFDQALMHLWDEGIDDVARRMEDLVGGQG